LRRTVKKKIPNRVRTAAVGTGYQTIPINWIALSVSHVVLLFNPFVPDARAVHQENSLWAIQFKWHALNTSGLYVHVRVLLQRVNVPSSPVWSYIVSFGWTALTPQAFQSTSASLSSTTVVFKVIDIGPQGPSGPSKGSINIHWVEWGSLNGH